MKSVSPTPFPVLDLVEIKGQERRVMRTLVDKLNDVAGG